MPAILFVCTANRFRSPVAAAVLTKCLVDRGIARSWRVRSAGTWAAAGKAVLPSVLAAALKFGIDLSGHRSAEVTRQMLSEYDLVIVMQAGQKEALLTEFPNLQDRIHLLSEIVEGRSYDIPDSKISAEEAEEVVEELHGLIRRGLGPICDLASRGSAVRQLTEI